MATGTATGAASGPSRAWRLFGLAALSVVLVLPLMLIGGLAVERMGYRGEAVRDIAASWGGPQTVTGPILAVPVTRLVTQRIARADGSVEEREEERRDGRMLLLPETLSVEAGLDAEIRERGIFGVPVYRGALEIEAGFDPGRLAREAGEDARLRWEEAELLLGVTSTQGLRGEIRLETAGGSLGFEPGTGIAGLDGISAATGDPRSLGPVRLTLGLNGSQGFRVAPAGRTTRAALRSDWPHPSFSGAFLPGEREVGDDGFSASWEVPHLARPVPQVLGDPGSVRMVQGPTVTEVLQEAGRRAPGAGGLEALAGAAFGAELYRPVDLYSMTARAAKYGILFIALSFAILFLMERWATRPLHVAQYALIGAAECVFFLLLLGFAEWIGFAAAYALATAATVALLTFYAISALGLGRRAGVLTAALLVLYGVLYLILAAEDHALLAGAILAFAAVAITMYATRNEDWSAAVVPRRAAVPGE